MDLIQIVWSLFAVASFIVAYLIWKKHDFGLICSRELCEKIKDIKNKTQIAKDFAKTEVAFGLSFVVCIIIRYKIKSFDGGFFILLIFIANYFILHHIKYNIKKYKY